MRGLSTFGYRPYRHMIYEQIRPYVCRVAPFGDGFAFEWHDEGDKGAHIVRYRKRGESAWRVKPLAGDTERIEGLETEVDYEFQVARADGSAESDLKFARPFESPWTVIDYIHPDEREMRPLGYCACSPTIVMLPSGALLAGHDVWAPGQPSNVSQIFRSDDGGQTWRYVTDLFPTIWPVLFVHRGALYCLGVTQEYGSLVISRSDDEGQTWRAPAYLVTGGGYSQIGPHKAPVPVIEHKERLYTAFEYGSWNIKDHQSALLSIGVNDDLTAPENWRFGPFLQAQKSWLGMPQDIRGGYIEGNAVVGPDGEIRNLLRVDHAGYGKAVLLRGHTDDPEARQTFERVVDCPLGSNSKFEVRRDEVTGMYVMIGTEQNETLRGRTVLSMAVSPDLVHWKIVKRLIDDREADPAKVGYQYPSWLFDGDDLCVAVRAAFNNADNFHNANYAIFLRVTNFRQYL